MTITSINRSVFYIDYQFSTFIILPNLKIMKLNSLFLLTVFCFSALLSSAQKSSISDIGIIGTKKVAKQEPHKYGGWYCPDNLGGFPAVDIKNWKDVPVVNGRMATQEETQNGTSLIFVDAEKYPNAKPLDMKMPKLARFYNHNSGKKEVVIIIQAINVSNDSIVGFRYLNGGNGSARLSEVKILTDKEAESFSPSRFVTLNFNINATKANVWEVLTADKYSKSLQSTFDKENKLTATWNKSAEVNYKYKNAGSITSAYAGNLFGNQYIQVDCEKGKYQYVEKFMVSDREKGSELIIVCGPFGDDFKEQKVILNNWAEKVKALSEKVK